MPAPLPPARSAAAIPGGLDRALFLNLWLLIAARTGHFGLSDWAFRSSDRAFRCRDRGSSVASSPLLFTHTQGDASKYLISHA